jgi:hypothetical protein
MINEAGETLLPESELSTDYNEVGVQVIEGFRLNLMKYARLSGKTWDQNADLFGKVAAKYDFDLVIGDEAFEVLFAMLNRKIQLHCRMIMIEDFIGLAAMTSNPLERLGVYRMSRSRINRTFHSSDLKITYFFVGELEDVPDKRFGLFLPNQREFAKQYYTFLGYVIRFDPKDYVDKAIIREKLGYGSEPLVICATGGTGAGMEMLGKCGEAYSIIKKDMPDLRMICVCGEPYGRKPPEFPSGVEVHGLIPNLYEHYAACDMAVVVGGMTTTIELTALRRPFIFFPLEGQFDQQIHVSARLARLEAGIRMRYHQTTPELLAQTIKANIHKEAKWKPISTNGATKAAELIKGYLSEH